MPREEATLDERLGRDVNIVGLDELIALVDRATPNLLGRSHVAQQNVHLVLCEITHERKHRTSGFETGRARVMPAA